MNPPIRPRRTEPKVKFLYHCAIFYCAKIAKGHIGEVQNEVGYSYKKSEILTLLAVFRCVFSQHIIFLQTTPISLEEFGANN